jgi:uncharacterized protein YciI
MIQKRKTVTGLCFLLLVLGLGPASAEEPVFDQALSDSFGADEYGMKSYSFVILKKGSVTVDDAEKKQQLMRGHLDNISRLAEEGKLVVAGPFGKNDLDYRGLFILTEPSTEEARKLLESDPAIAAGVFDVEVIPWYGAAALGAYLEVQKKITKTNP